MKRNLFLTLISVSLLSACSSDYIYEEPRTEPRIDRKNNGMGKLLGEETLVFGGSKKRGQEDTGLGVNSYLWRASLDTVSFMPIASADPFGGVIITDWYSPPQSPQERLKINIFILDRQLRSDGLKVSVFRQDRDASGHWTDLPVDPQTITDLENAILTRARHFRSTAIK
ncbi:MAG: DUF3576 domain-containing protein [Proteobacteria bacterium]|nr:DUF3576 domain-containing protein [Pseudomonadota bacterium]